MYYFIFNYVKVYKCFVMNGLEIKNKRKELGLTQEALGKLLGVSKRTIINYEQGEIIPETKNELLHNILNENNLVSDLKNKTNNIEVEYLDGLRSSIMFVPLVNQYAYGGYMNGFSDKEYVENLPKIPFVLDKEYKGDYLCFEVKGDSMESDTRESLNEGDILLCRNVKQEHWHNKLHINQWDFVIVHKEKGIVVKRILKHDIETGELVLHSLNDFYSDYSINIKDVDQIFNIVDVQQKRKRR